MGLRAKRPWVTLSDALIRAQATPAASVTSRPLAGILRTAKRAIWPLPDTVYDIIITQAGAGGGTPAHALRRAEL